MKYNLIVIVTTVTLAYTLYIEGTNETRASKESNVNHAENFTNTLTATKTINPCNEIHFDMPDFRQPGRRISEIKCLEYKWNIQTIEDLGKQNKKCEKFLQNFNTTVKRVKRQPVFAGGHLTKQGDLPHMGAIGWKAAYGGWIFKCGGTLISRKHMVTAAHCSKASSRDSRLANPVPQIVRLGTKNIIRTESGFQRDLKIMKIIQHPRYSYIPKRYFDIALVELENRIYFNKHIHPACLWYNTDTSSLGMRASACGWGVTGEGRKDTTTELLEGSLDIISNDVCNELLLPWCNRLWCGLEEHQMCAGVLRGGIDVCQGDSGGPLHVKIPLKTKHKLYYLVGVTSFGFGCARRNTPSVYARVSSFVDWIENIVWGNEVANITGINTTQTLN